MLRAIKFTFAVLLLAFIKISVAQVDLVANQNRHVLLGEPPKLGRFQVYKNKYFFKPRALKSFSIDPSERQSVVDGYLNNFLPLYEIPMNWTGSLTGCDAGETDVAYSEAMIDAVNYFRAMVSLPPVTHDASLDSNAQKAALMMAANKELSHSPPTNWDCYTKDGSDSAGNSNIHLLWSWGADSEFEPAPKIIKSYMIDSGDNNKDVGHRRWILFPKASAFGTGSVGPVSHDNDNYRYFANALDVLSAGSTTGSTNRPSNPTIITWPNKGFVPVQLLVEGDSTDTVRWSFSINDSDSSSIDYSNARVSMKDKTNGDTLVKTKVVSSNKNYGDRAIVWETPELSLERGKPDRTFDITISNMQNAPQTSYNYKVTVIDPKPRYKISGELTGFTEKPVPNKPNYYYNWITLELERSSGENEELTLFINREFSFSQLLDPGEDYSISIKHLPDEDMCEIENDSAENIKAHVDNVLVRCEPKTYTLSGNIKNLKGEIILENNGENDTFNNVKDYKLSKRVAYGDEYDIKIESTPDLQRCDFEMPSTAKGTAKGKGVIIDNIDISCIDLAELNIRITGLKGEILVSVNKDQKIINYDGVISLGKFDKGEPYDLKIKKQSDNQKCTLFTKNKKVGDDLEATINCVDYVDIDFTKDLVGGQLNCPNRELKGDKVTCTAKPYAHYEVDSWSGECGNTTGKTCQFTASDKNVVGVTFKPKVYVIQTTSGENGKVDCPANAAYGTKVTCTAKSDTHYEVDSWSGECANTTGKTCQFTASDKNVVGVTFKPKVYVIQTTSGENGKVDCPANAAYGTKVTCTATPNPHHEVASWSGACANTTGKTCQFTASDKNVVGVTFKKVAKLGVILSSSFEN